MIDMPNNHEGSGGFEMPPILREEIIYDALDTVVWVVSETESVTEPLSEDLDYAEGGLDAPPPEMDAGDAFGFAPEASGEPIDFLDIPLVLEGDRHPDSGEALAMGGQGADDPHLQASPQPATTAERRPEVALAHQRTNRAGDYEQAAHFREAA